MLATSYLRHKERLGAAIAWLLPTQLDSTGLAMALEPFNPLLNSLSFFVRELLDPHVSRPVRHVGY